MQKADASGFHHPVIALLCPEVDRKDTCNWQTEKNEEKGKEGKVFTCFAALNEHPLKAS